MRAVLLAGAVVVSGAIWLLARSNGLGVHGSGAALVAACGPTPLESPYPGMVFVPAVRCGRWHLVPVGSPPRPRDRL